jgi:hypothetical protein
MHRRAKVLGMAAVLLLLAGEALAGQFVVFPQAGQLVSPDGRFVVRSTDRQGTASEFVGTFHALWLTELTTGRSSKLCDYLGVAAVAWSSGNSLIVTQYVGKKSSRALVFSMATPDEVVMLDTATTIRMVPVELRPVLRENDHVFIEGSRVEGETLLLRVWGYGQRDVKGFRWRCEYGLREGNLSCTEEPKAN